MRITGHITGHQLITGALRPVAVLATGAVIATTLTAPAQAAPTDRGTDWLAGQLTDGVVYNDQYDFEDLGLTVDVGLAFKDLGGHGPDLRTVRRAMSERVDAYTRFDSPDIYANATAKLLAFAQRTGKQDKVFGGVNLARRLNKRVVGHGRSAGRIADKTTFADSANTIGQAFAVKALATAGSRKAGRAKQFLMKQQCDAGWFRLYFADADARQQKCGQGDSADTDATAFAVMGLRSLPRAHRGKAVRGAIQQGLRWLVRSQKNNGGHVGGPPQDVVNANSSGLAAQALGDAGRCRPAQKAARWVRALQVDGDAAGTSLAGERGAIAYDQAAYDSAETDGITVESRDQWRRTSAQAVSGLTYTKVGPCRR